MPSATLRRRAARRSARPAPAICSSSGSSRPSGSATTRAASAPGSMPRDRARPRAGQRPARSRAASTATRLEALSERQREVLALMAEGRTNAGAHGPPKDKQDQVGKKNWPYTTALEEARSLIDRQLELFGQTISYRASPAGASRHQTRLQPAYSRSDIASTYRVLHTQVLGFLQPVRLADIGPGFSPANNITVHRCSIAIPGREPGYAIINTLPTTSPGSRHVP